MGFTDAGIEKSIWKLLSYRFQLITLAHGSGHDRGFGVLLHLIQNRIPCEMCVGFSASLAVGDWSAIFLFECRWRVEIDRVFSRRFKSVTLFGDHVE